MTTPLPTKDDIKLYPETLYYAERISQCGHQPVYKRLLPDGVPTELNPEPSQKLLNSPNDFQFGYCGSEPAQLSLALLLDATSDPKMALAFYQDFKWGFVSTLGDVWSITRNEILRWLEVQGKKQLEAMVNRN